MATLTRQHFEMFAEQLVSMWFSTPQLDWEKNVDCVIKLCKFSNERFDEKEFRTYIDEKFKELFKGQSCYPRDL